MTDTQDRTGLSPLKQALLAIEELQARLAAVEQSRGEPVAVVGIGCRLPGGVCSFDDYRALLREGRDAIGPIPPDRWDADAWYDPDPDAPGKIGTNRGGFVEGIDRFDPAFFGIAPREAATMDPQQRLLLEVAWEALEHAGIPPDSLAGSRTGVFTGLYNANFARLGPAAGDARHVDAYSASGNAPSVASGRIAYVLGLHGPALTIDTACSSSLVAIHLAVRSLRDRECDTALAGGVNLILSPATLVASTKLKVLSPDGRCKTFDADADGFAQAEGCGLVVLKRLADAARDGDRILAVILGSAVNQDGRSAGLTAPNGKAQEAVVRAALADARVRPDEVGHVEAHGTGTTLGDPIEVEALAAALGNGRAAGRPLILGSAKTNLGHLESAAGVAGFIKAVAAVLDGEIPRLLHFRRVNPQISTGDVPILYPGANTPWPAAYERRVAGVSAFGFSGTNAHVVLESPSASPAVPSQPGPIILTLSAKSEPALRDLARRYAEFLARPDAPPFDAVCATACRGRTHFAHRLAVVAANADEAVTRLRAYLDGTPNDVRPSPLDQLAATYLRGGEPRWADDANRTPPPRVTLPGYPFQRSRHWPDFDAVATVEPPPAPPIGGEVISGYYDDLAAATPHHADADTTSGEGHLTFGVFPRVVPGFAWLPAFLFPDRHPEHHRLLTEAQRRMKAVALDRVDFTEAARVLDFGCGHAADLIELASRFPNLRLDGYTLSAGQAELGRGRAKALGFGDRVRVFHRDSARDPFPERYDVVVGFEVAGNIPDKAALFANIGDHLADGGRLLMADFVARDGDVVSPATGCSTPDAAGWGDLLAARKIRVVDCIDVTAEVANFLHDPDHQRHLDEAVRERGLSELTRSHLRSQENIRRALASGLLRYVLLVAEKSRLQPLALIASENRVRLSEPILYADLPPTAGDDLFYGVEWRPRPLEGSGAVVSLSEPANRARAAVARLRQEHGLDALRELGPAVERLSGVYAARALASLEEAPATNGPAWGKRLTRRLAEMVEPGTPSLPDPAADLAELSQRFPACAAELALLSRCGPRLADVVRGTCDPLSLLFPPGTAAGAEAIYRDSPYLKLANGAAVEMLRGIVSNVPAGRTLRVLEVGAGTGATTAHLLPVLPPNRTEYMFTDVSPLFPAQAAEKFGAFPFVRYKVFDLEKPPESQGFAGRTFDLVVAANCLHTTRDLGETLAHFRSLLVPGGVLLLIENTSPVRWADLTFGLTEGWWRFTDTDRRPRHPLLNREGWQRTLADAGFDDVEAVTDGEPDHGGFLQQAVFLARARADADAAGRWLIVGDRGGFGRELAARLAARCGEVTLTDGDADVGALLSAAGAAWRGVVHLRSLDATPGEGTTAETLRADVAASCGSLLRLVQAVGKLAEPVRVWAVTRGAATNLPSPLEGEGGCERSEKPDEGSAVENPPHTRATFGRLPSPSRGEGVRAAEAAIAQSPIAGFVRAVTLEQPELAATWFDLDPAAGTDAVESLVDELVAGSAETQVAVRGGVREVARLARVSVPATGVPIIRADGTYLITGGLRGIGPEVAAWLAGLGAKHLTLLGRNPPSEEVRLKLDSLAEAGVSIRIVQGDVADRDAVAKAISTEGGPQLRGVIHSAGLLDDGVLGQQTWERFERVLAPKVWGAWHLHEAVKALPLDFFVLFSSSASLLGSSAQVNHSAANAFLDGLAAFRRSLGLPALSVNWGAWADVGAAAGSDVEAKLQRQGIARMSPAEALAALGRAMASGLSQVGILRVDWTTYRTQFTTHGIPAYLEELCPAPAGPLAPTPAITPAPPVDSLAERLRAAFPAERPVLLLDHVSRSAAVVLGLEPHERLDPRQPLNELGLDSLMAVELRNKLAASVGKPLPATLLFDHPTPAAVVDYLAGVLGEVAPQPAAPEPTADTDDLGDILDREMRAAERLLDGGQP